MASQKNSDKDIIPMGKAIVIIISVVLIPVALIIGGGVFLFSSMNKDNSSTTNANSENTSYSVTTSNQPKQNIAPTATTDEIEKTVITETPTTNKTADANTLEGYKLYLPIDYGVIDYGSLVNIEENALVSTDMYHVYGYSDVNYANIVAYDTGLKEIGEFEGGLFDDSNFKTVDDFL